MACSVLTSLPDSIISAITTSWLPSIDLGRLDTAYCSTCARPAFLAALVAGTTSVNFDDVDRPPLPSGEIEWDTYENFLRWTVLRGARISELVMCGAVFNDPHLRSKLVSTSSAMIRSIEFPFGVVEDPLSSDEINDYTSTIGEMASACGRVTALKVNGDWGTDSILPSIIQAFGQIEILKLHSLELPAEGLRYIPRNLSTLRRLTISAYSRFGAILPPDLFVPTLMYFNGCGCDVTDDLAVALGQNCPLLHTLRCYDHSNTLTDRGAHALLQGCPQLRTCSVEYFGGVSDELRVELTRRCDISKLCLSLWSKMNDMLAKFLVAVLPELVELDAVMCPWLTDATLAVAARQCTALEELRLYHVDLITIAGIMPFIRPGNKLKALTLRGTADDALMQLIGEHCKELHTLQVFDCSTRTLKARPTDVGVRAVLQGCPLLRKTDVEYAVDISLDLRVELVRRGAYVSLQLNDWYGLSEELLIRMFAVCPRLESLKCYNSEALTDAAFLACAQHCPRLETLEIRRCPAVTSLGLIEFFRPRNKLKFINLACLNCVTML
jgi:hypothetical protein